MCSACKADGEYFDISDPAHIVRDSFTIGKAAQETPGYYVGEGCIGCKLCYSVCPQGHRHYKEACGD